MFDDWKQAWREAVDNFRREAEGDDVGTPRVRAMERELTSAAGALARLDEEIRRTTRERDGEVEAAVVCRRREQLARDAGDEETVRLAVEWGARHEQRASILERKIAVLQDERMLLDRDVGEMRGMIAAAAARGGTTGSAAGSGATGGIFGNSHEDHRDEQDRTFSRLEREARERAAEERLAELKRRMQN